MCIASRLLLSLLACLLMTPAHAEFIWLEAEHAVGLRGYCWPMGRPAMRQTEGCWGLSGPGWAAEWTQGGESGFLSIATGPGDDKARAELHAEVPSAGHWRLWVRYGDWREQSERFAITITQGERRQRLVFGAQPKVEEDQVMKLYWGWAFVWDHAEVALEAGPVTVTLEGAFAEAVPRQLDCLVLCDDPAYRPLTKERPANPAWALLDSWRQNLPPHLEPLTRALRPGALPPAWRRESFQDQDFLYLWNSSSDLKVAKWLGDDPKRVPVPYNIGDAAVRTEFETTWAGRTDVPIFGDSRLVPLFHGSGPAIFRADPKTGELGETGQHFAAWLEAHPERYWGGMMNYAPDLPLGEAGLAAFLKYRDRYVGSIAGESLGYCEVPAATMRAATAGLSTRRQLAEVLTTQFQQANAAKYRKVFGRDLDANAWTDVISCLSVGNITFAPLQSAWGVRTIGYESAVIPYSLLAMRWAFLRGAARQGRHLTATYRSANFGDAATMFSEQASYTKPGNIQDNFYSVYSGAGMTWYKFDLWYQYLAGANFFYHEQGFDEFWKPGGTSAAGVKPVQLSPKGQLVDRFLRLTADPTFKRGTPWTPIAFLVDYAHGWEPSPYWPNAFKNFHQQPDQFLYGQHDRQLEELFRLAWHPLGPSQGQPITATSEVFVPGVFGDVFDVIYAYPDAARWTSIASYPVVVVAGEIALTATEGQRLADYLAGGGTVLLSSGQLSGPGLAALPLPAMGEVMEADAYQWLTMAPQAAPRFRCRPIVPGPGDRALAMLPTGEVIVSAREVGQGRLITMSIPYGLGIAGQASPLWAWLLAHLRSGLMPVEVAGAVQWLLNDADGEWVVTLINPAGQAKPQQGITPTDFRENRMVTVRAAQGRIAAVRDLLLPGQALQPNPAGEVQVEVSAGGLRVLSLTLAP